MAYCNYQCKQDKFLDQRKILFQKKLNQYYTLYENHLRDLKAVANKPNPHNQMAAIKRKNEGPLKRLESEINSILNSIKQRIYSVTSDVKKNKKEININNNDIDKLKSQLAVQEKKIMEKRTELESKKKQLQVGNQTNKYRRHILYLLIFFNIFLIIVIVFLLKGSGSGNIMGDNAGDAAGEGAGDE